MNLKRLPPALLALSPGDLLPAQVPAFLVRTRAALQAGLRGVLLRESRLGDRDFLSLARALGERLAAVAGWLGVHDRAHLVAASAAHGLHLGFRSLTLGEARGLVGPGVALGTSTHAADAPRAWSGADYRFFGPVHETPHKERSLAPVGFAGVATAVRVDAVPVWALGGLGPESVRTLAGAGRPGVAGVAVLSGLLAAPDPGAAARAYLAAWEDGVAQRGTP